MYKRQGMDQPYERLKELTRGRRIGADDLRAFIDGAGADGAGAAGEPGRVAAVALVVGPRARLLVGLLDAGDSAGVAVPAAEATVSPGAWPTAEAAGGAMAASAAMVSIAVVAEVLRTMPARIQAR